jgi:hypothetical protein
VPPSADECDDQADTRAAASGLLEGQVAKLHARLHDAAQRFGGQVLPALPRPHYDPSMRAHVAFMTVGCYT